VRVGGYQVVTSIQEVVGRKIVLTVPVTKRQERQLPTRPMRLALWALTLAAFVLSWLGGRCAAEEFRFDFRNSQFDNEALRLFGSGTSQFVKPTKKGLAISAPKDKQVKELGFGPKFTLRGDFEITAGFEITKFDDPDAGYGVGPSLYIATNSFASLTRHCPRENRESDDATPPACSMPDFDRKFSVGVVGQTFGMNVRG